MKLLSFTLFILYSCQAFSQNLQPLNPSTINPIQLKGVQLVTPDVPPTPNFQIPNPIFVPQSTNVPVEIPYSPNAFQKNMNQFVEKAKNFSKPSSSQQSYFEKWLYNTKLESVSFCWKYAHRNVSINYPNDFPAMIPNVATSFFEPPEKYAKQWCEHISNNDMTPSCYNLKFIGDFLPIDENLSKYVHFYRTNSFNVRASADCFIDSKKMIPQPFVGYTQATMQKNPEQSKIFTAFGTKNAIIGDLDVKIPGYPLEKDNSFKIKAIFGVIQ